MDEMQLRFEIDCIIYQLDELNAKMYDATKWERRKLEKERTALERKLQQLSDDLSLLPFRI